jgi:hypothetical protein
VTKTVTVRRHGITVKQRIPVALRQKVRHSATATVVTRLVVTAPSRARTVIERVPAQRSAVQVGKRTQTVVVTKFAVAAKPPRRPSRQRP